MTSLHEPVRARLDGALATITFAFPGNPANALTVPRLAELVDACELAAARPEIEVVAIDSDAAGGFCPGATATALAHLQVEANRTAYTVAGQRLLGRLAGLPAVTVAVITGVCRGPGFELALACDYRLAVARPDSWVGVGAELAPAWGTSARIGRRARRLLTGVATAREAVKLGAFHDAYSARRAAVETRLWLDKLLESPVKPGRGRWFGPCDASLLAAERCAFRRSAPGFVPAPAAAPLPGSVGVPVLAASNAGLVAEFAARGAACLVGRGDKTLVESALAAGLKRGRWTPLEAEQASGRVRLGVPVAEVRRAGLVLGAYDGVDAAPQTDRPQAAARQGPRAARPRRTRPALP